MSNLTISFNEQWQELRFKNLSSGRVKFGIRGGELILELTNGKIPYGSRSFNDPMSLSADLEVETAQGQESQSSVGGSWSSDKPGVTAKQDSKRTDSRKEKFQKTTSYISTKGSEERPTWVFEAGQDEPVLKGTLSEEKLATMEIVGHPYKITATFEISRGDVRFTEGEGIWLRNLMPNKRALFEGEIIKWLLDRKLKPYLSKVELSSRPLPPSNPLLFSRKASAFNGLII
ncbi:MAG: hypothetical protein SW833_23465 [Cyanobacteriota bacterium]|nr:hypothetical protein [Cyanobacteriota bacterium]